MRRVGACWATDDWFAIQKKILSEVTVVSIGGPKSADVLRPGVLAMGADKAIHVKVFVRLTFYSR